MDRFAAGAPLAGLVGSYDPEATAKAKDEAVLAIAAVRGAAGLSGP